MSITAPQGFVAAGLACGVKDSGDPDLSLVATADGRAVAAAGVFTQNQMTAAPVQVSREHLRRTAGRAGAVVLNSGNANAATGAPGLADAHAMCAAVGEALASDPHEVLVCSTGLIGIPLPIARIVDAVPSLVAARGASPEHARAAAEAIRTTDTFAKEVVVERPGFTVGGMAKGAAMLAPNMATMLAVLTTDAAAEPDVLLEALRRAVASTFNAMTTDGCTSTNDTVLVLASGARGPADPDELADAVRQACESLAMQMVSDAEGATKSVRIDVIGAASNEEAMVGARKVADSNLCKCSWYGQDPYWGRVASELGSAGIAFDQEKVCIAYGGVVVADGGVEVDHDRGAVAAHMAGRDLHVVADLGIGTGTGTIYTNDLTHAYVDENMGDLVSADTILDAAHDRAAVLVEALPYIRAFAGATVVIKFGGNAMVDPALADRFAEDVVLLHTVGLRPVVVHGGGPQIGELMQRLGKEPEFVDGRRVTDAETLDIARMVLVGKVNRELVSAINVHAPVAVGLSGEDAGLIVAEMRDPDLGFVGDVESINPSIVDRLLAEHLVPVISTIGSDVTGQAYNINADTVAGEIAAAVSAEKVVYLTDVPGLLRNVDDPSSLISQIDVAEIRELIDDGTLTGGMIPKIEACLAALAGGVRSAHLLDGRLPHVVLLELFTDAGVGTMIVGAP